MKITVIPFLLCAVALSGCTSIKPLPSKYDLPVMGITHLFPLQEKQEFVFCSICPKPTPKTLDIPEEKPVVVQPAPFVYTPPVAPVEPIKKPEPIKFIVPFRLDSSQLGPRGHKAVEQIIASFNEVDITKYDVAVHGYTDDLAGHQYNKKLAWQRAHTVLGEIRKAGERMPIMVTAEGECCFISDNSSKRNRAPNRRVEVIIVLQPK